MEGNNPAFLPFLKMQHRMHGHLSKRMMEDLVRSAISPVHMLGVIMHSVAGV